MAEKKEAEGLDSLAQRVRRIYESANLSEAEKDRMIAELLPKSPPVRGGLNLGRITVVYLVSFFLPLSGLVFAVHYLFHYEEEGRKVAIIATMLTLIGLFLLWWFFNLLTAALKEAPF